MEIEIRQQGAGVGECPEISEPLINDTFAEREDDEQCEDTYDSIGEAGGEFVDAEDLHAQDLHPYKERWLFVKRLVVDLHVHVIAGYDHFAGAFGEVDLVPVEQPDRAKEREKERKGDKADD